MDMENLLFSELFEVNWFPCFPIIEDSGVCFTERPTKKDVLQNGIQPFK